MGITRTICNKFWQFGNFFFFKFHNDTWNMLVNESQKGERTKGLGLLKGTGKINYFFYCQWLIFNRGNNIFQTM